MFNNFQYSYLIGCIFFLIIWLILYIKRKDVRTKMLKMSIVVAPLGPLSSPLFLRDYWHPQFFNGWTVGIEDALFSFAIAGIAVVIYEELLGKRYISRHLKSHSKWMLGAAVFGIIWMYIGNEVLNFNSIYVSTSGLILIGLAVVIIRHDLLKDALFSGLIMSLIMLVFYSLFSYTFHGIIQEWWHLKNLSGIIIAGAPLEELMWGFGWGFIAGPAYEFINGLKFRKQ